jgi:hypothetical protein
MPVLLQKVAQASCLRKKVTDRDVCVTIIVTQASSLRKKIVAQIFSLRRKSHRQGCLEYYGGKRCGILFILTLLLQQQ